MRLTDTTGKKPIPTRRTNAVDASPVDAAALAEALRAAVRGEVRFDAGSRAMYSTDASNYRQIPIGVVLPKDAADVIATLAAARAFGAPVVSRGGGTSLAGETCNVAVVMDFSKYMNRVTAIDWERKVAAVEPGCVLDDLRNLAEERDLTFGPDPATHSRNTLGGMIGNNSCGMHAQMAGKVEENIEWLDIVTYDGVRMRVGPTSDEELRDIIAAGGRQGEIYAKLKAIAEKYGDEIRKRFPKIPRLVSGFALQQLLPENGFNVAKALVGTEGTCVTVLEAGCRLVHSPQHRTLAIFGFENLPSAGDQVPFCDSFGPIALEGLDASMFDYMAKKGMSTEHRSMFPSGNAWLIVEFGADSKPEADAKARKLADAFTSRPNPPGAKIYDKKADMAIIWEIRESGLGSTSKIPNEGDYYPGWEDSAVAPERLGDYLRDFLALLEKYGYRASVYGHFGQACVHCSINFDLYTTDGIAKYRRFVTEAAHVCVAYGGSLSGEHGDGQARGELLPIMFGEDLVQAFWEFKSAWDPENKMNPGKVVHPYKLDENLRWGVNYQPWDPDTYFKFKNDRGSFAYAANRCVGAGVCRKHDGGTMCPSYMATKEEAYSTRGRARLLFEMMEGNPLKNGWADNAVKEALDFCLACKACKTECPVNVDMATYKAEFLSHYYEEKPRPIAAYAFGLMYWWARAASVAPRLVNFITQAPGLREISKALATMAPQRRIPIFAAQTFVQWFSKRTASGGGQPPSAPEVILWPDTWNNHFHPTTAQAAVAVLEDAGFRVTIPKMRLCCGRPLYDYGMLSVAKTLLLQILEALRPQIRAGVPIVGLEPSCVSVFRDEMCNLLPDDHDALRLRDQVFLFEEFLAKKAPAYDPPLLHRKAVVHEHCHHKSVLDKGSGKALFTAMGLDYDMPDTGCCGMAGAFGFEADHYDVSVAIGERVLLPAVRKAKRNTLVVADGFSCREQISQLTDRQALHPAEVVKMAIDARDGKPATESLPERQYMGDPGAEARQSTKRGICAVAITLAACCGVLFIVRGWKHRD
ncbi:MAG: FAD-binding oxidoreductase [Candidatus Eremiobacteraeota bacterium]|nr:FAD-binding oxidoreductase [Candidatus Eremiobacteraeota bacterium]